MQGRRAVPHYARRVIPTTPDTSNATLPTPESVSDPLRYTNRIQRFIFIVNVKSIDAGKQ